MLQFFTFATSLLAISNFNLVLSEDRNQCVINAENECVFQSIYVAANKDEKQNLQTPASSNTSTIKFISSAIDFVTPTLLRSVNRVRALDLSGVKLKGLHHDALQNFEVLEDVDLSNNVLVELPQGVFSDVNQLRNLDISHNNLRHLEGHVFENCPELRRLELYGNSIAEISREHFRIPRELDYLSLGDNRIER
nr:leucine-rich repeat-containing protein 15-like [Aedes albopictus]